MSLLEDIRSSALSRQGLIAGLAFVALCLGGAIAYFAFVRVPYQVLFSNLRPADAAAIIGDLDKKKTPYRLADGGATIMVPTPVADATRLDVISEDLPLKGQVGFELFNKSDMGLTEFAQKINYQRALQGELARTIMSLDAVDTARVHLSLPDPSVFRDDKRSPKASATLIARTGRQITPAAVAGIRRLIAAAVPDLDPADVVILDERGDVLGSGALDAIATETPFGLAPVASDAELHPQSHATSAAEVKGVATPGSASTLLTTASLIVLIPLVFLAGWLARRKPARRMSEIARARYAARLRELLDDGRADAVPRF